MDGLRDRILKELRRRGADAQLGADRALERRLGGLERELLETRQRIPLWDRLNFFSDTPDERHAKGLKRELRAAEAERRKVAAVAARAVEALGAELPPFGIGAAVERCGSLARSGEAAQRALKKELAALGARLLSTWAPDLDVEEALESLAGEAACRAAAAGAEAPLAGDERLLHAPMEAAAVVQRVARRLLDGPFFLEEARQGALARRRDELVDAYAAAREAVPLGDKLNVFRRSEAEAARDAAGAAAWEAEEALRVASERRRGFLLEALAAYPPLALLARVLECAGLAAALRTGKEPAFAEDGSLVNEPVVVPRALLLGAVRRLEEAFRAAFPGVPLPREAARDLSEARGWGSDVPPPFAPLVDGVLAALSGGPAAAAREVALSEARLRGGVARALGRVRGRITFLDRLVFWSDTRAEVEEERLEARARWHEDAAARRWQALFAAARKAGGTVGPFRLRDGALALAQAIAAIHTDGGQSSIPRSCGVYGREEARAALAALRLGFAEEHGLSGSFGELLEGMAAAARAVAPGAAPAPRPEVHDRQRVYRPLAAAELASALGAPLAGTPFADALARLRAAETRALEARAERAQLSERISVWDWINVFSTTPDEKRRKELGRTLAHLSGSIAADLATVDRLFDEAGAIYPPAWLLHRLEMVSQAVESIRAVCRSRTVSRGTGKNRRTETVYYCSLVGKADAVAAVQRWAAVFVRAYGRLPGYHALLELWELRQGEAEAVRW